MTNSKNESNATKTYSLNSIIQAAENLTRYYLQKKAEKEGVSFNPKKFRYGNRMQKFIEDVAFKGVVNKDNKIVEYPEKVTQYTRAIHLAVINNLCPNGAEDLISLRIKDNSNFSTTGKSIGGILNTILTKGNGLTDVPVAIAFVVTLPVTLPLKFAAEAVYVKGKTTVKYVGSDNKEAFRKDVTDGINAIPEGRASYFLDAETGVVTTSTPSLESEQAPSSHLPSAPSLEGRGEAPSYMAAVSAVSFDETRGTTKTDSPSRV